MGTRKSGERMRLKVLSLPSASRKSTEVSTVPKIFSVFGEIKGALSRSMLVTAFLPLSLHRLALVDRGQMKCLGLRLRIAKGLSLKTVFFRQRSIPLTCRRLRDPNLVSPKKL